MSYMRRNHGSSELSLSPSPFSLMKYREPKSSGVIFDGYVLQIFLEGRGLTATKWWHCMWYFCRNNAKRTPPAGCLSRSWFCKDEVGLSNIRAIRSKRLSFHLKKVYGFFKNLLTRYSCRFKNWDVENDDASGTFFNWTLLKHHFWRRHVFARDIDFVGHTIS